MLNRNQTSIVLTKFLESCLQLLQLVNPLHHIFLVIWQFEIEHTGYVRNQEAILVYHARIVSTLLVDLFELEMNNQ